LVSIQSRADNGSVRHGSNGSTNLGGLRVSARDPLTHFTLYSFGIQRDFVVHGKPATQSKLLFDF